MMAPRRLNPSVKQKSLEQSRRSVASRITTHASNKQDGSTRHHFHKQTQTDVRHKDTTVGRALLNFNDFQKDRVRSKETLFAFVLHSPLSKTQPIKQESSDPLLTTSGGITQESERKAEASTADARSDGALDQSSSSTSEFILPYRPAVLQRMSAEDKRRAHALLLTSSHQGIITISVED